MAEHGRRRLRLGHDAHGHVGLGEALESLLHVAGRLVLGDDVAEAVDGARVVALLQVEAADLHLLAGELVARDLDLLLGVGRIFGPRIAVEQFLQRQQRPLGLLLVAVDVGDLFEMRHREEVLRVGRVRGGRVELEVAPRRP